MANEYLDLIIRLEDDLARFYEMIKKLVRLKMSREVLEYMEVHSYEHARRVEAFKLKNKKPQFSTEAVVQLHDQIINTVQKSIQHEKDILVVLNKLAGSEDSVGKLYTSMAKYLQGLSSYYKIVAEEIDKIAGEEFNHRDLLLENIKRYKDKS
jgi:hypothetical protein